MAKILIADDNEGLREVLLELVQGLGHEAVGVADGCAAREALCAGDFDLLLTDLRMPKLDGLSLLRELDGLGQGVDTIVMTAHGSVGSAVEAMHLGALDYVEKPFPLGAMEAKIQKALERRQLARQNTALRRELAQRYGSVIGASPPMQRVFSLIEKVSQADTPVLLLGESGTGKELVAREIHERSARAGGPFVTVNCAALAESLLESELFGHEAGSFTGATGMRRGKFELAEGGTVFLDELGEISLSTQVKLLRFLQEKEIERVGGDRVIKVDARVVAATNRDLKAMVERGEFREDFFYRINVINIELPPLRARLEDVPLLVEALLERHQKATGLSGRVSDEVLALLRIYEWPGNVRELENVLERALVLAESGPDGVRRITPDTLPPEVFGGEGDPESRKQYHEVTGLMAQIERIEREIIRKALEENDWNQTRAAKALKLKRSSLQYKMKKYELSKPK
ncbi:MAG: sigma-54-dependent Fis family transcriptional regulator [Planctomycetota bacterium]|nr:MAG: sigma-54-dependent Fis family transcriptional regulator [Planctomycetota bacterium]